MKLQQRDRRAFDHLGRNLTCMKCGALVCVHELPGPFLDRDRFVCGECLVPKVEAA